MSVATGAVVTGAQEMLDGTARKLVNELQDTEGLTEEDAKDVIGNIFLDLAVNSASIFTVLRTGLGVKAAQFLGLTSKGFAKKALTGKAATAAAKVAGPWEKFRAMGLVSKIMSVGGVFAGLTWIGVGIANIIEPGIYKPKEANDVWEKFIGVRPFPDPKIKLYPGPFTNTSSVTFSDYAKSLEAAGIKGLSNPVAMQTQIYSRDNLAEIVDYVYGKEVANGKALSVKELLPKMAPYLLMAPGSSATAGASVASPAVAPITKVFTGIVSQGVVGAGLVFTPRPDDLIESAEELRTAAANNLAPFLAALPGKIVYEVKVVSSIITREGFRQTGRTQRIQTGTYANGQPKYKTVTNKFATLVVYALTDKGSRAKLTTIVLGPTDAAKLQVAQGDLRTLEGELPALVTTTNIAEVQNITPAASAAVTAPAPTPAPSRAPTTTGYWALIDAPNGLFQTAVNKAKDDTAQSYKNVKAKYEKIGLSIKGGQIVSENPGRPTWTNSDLPGAVKPTSQPGTVPAVSGSSQPALKPGSSATTLFEWYQAQGQQLPTVAKRANLYENLGLGQANYYTGTAEQNTRLLNAVKTSPNIPSEMYELVRISA